MQTVSTAKKVTDQAKPNLEHLKPGTAKHAWVEFADSPGVKGEKHAREKMKNDYGGHANLPKDLARLTLRFSAPGKLADIQKKRETEKRGVELPSAVSAVCVVHITQQKHRRQPGEG